MVGGATHQQPQPSQLAPPPSSSSTAPPPTTEEDEFLKRNTDCVYFLASPLTCKKGSECEYRHSDIARVNPRDCWYWLNGNCLNPKCGFRHPPLDGLLGAEVPTPVGPSIPQAPVTPTPPYGMSKQGVACIFFQKGFCLKGHLCPFLHGPPNMVNNKVVQPLQPNPVTKPSKMASAGSEKSIQEQKFMQQESVQNPDEFLPPQGKQVPRMPPASAPERNGGGGGGGSGSGGAMKKNVAPPLEEPPRYRPASVIPPPVVNEFPASRSNHGVYETHYVSDSDGILNGKDVDEYSREPTPGFDVLVDNELGDSEYYPNEEQFGGRSRGHDFDIGRSTDYDVDRDIYGERRDYDRYNEEGYAWVDHHRTSSERMLGDASSFGRKRYPRDDSPDQFDKSDLRHRISKQRRGNVGGGLRSVVSSEHPRDSRPDRMPRTDSHHHHRRLDPVSLSSRLRGRIKIPGRSMSPGNEKELRVQREIDMGRQHRSRYSPGRLPHTSSNHSRLRDRIKGRGIEDFNDHRRREMVPDNDGEFSGPKRLSELKCGDDGQSLGKRKYPRVESQQTDGNLWFEGPKPLSEILKRKRGGSVVSCVNNEDNKEMMVHGNKEEPAEKQSGSMNGDGDEDAMLDQELEAYDGRDGDGDYDYEQMDGEEYNLEEEDDGGKKEKEVYS